MLHSPSPPPIDWYTYDRGWIWSISDQSTLSTTLLCSCVRLQFDWLIDWLSGQYSIVLFLCLVPFQSHSQFSLQWDFLSCGGQTAPFWGHSSDSTHNYGNLQGKTDGITTHLLIHIDQCPKKNLENRTNHICLNLAKTLSGRHQTTTESLIASQFQA